MRAKRARKMSAQRSHHKKREHTLSVSQLIATEGGGNGPLAWDVASVNAREATAAGGTGIDRSHEPAQLACTCYGSAIRPQRRNELSGTRGLLRKGSKPAGPRRRPFCGLVHESAAPPGVSPKLGYFIVSPSLSSNCGFDGLALFKFKSFKIFGEFKLSSCFF